MPLQRPGDLGHRLEPRLGDFLEPVVEERPRVVLVAALPEVGERLLQAERDAGVESAPQEVPPPRGRLVAQVLEPREPEVLGLREPLVVALRQHAVLVPPHPVDALVQVHLDVEPVVHDVGVRHPVPHGLAERGGHVHGDAADHVLLRRVQRLVDERLRALLAAAARHVEDPVVVEVGHDAREVVGLLAVQEALLVHPDERDLVRPAPRKPALHGGLHDVVRLPPAEAQELLRVPDRLRGLQDVDGERLEHQREARVLRRPRQLDDLHAVPGAAHARRPGVDQRLELHRVQVPPRPLLLLVVDGAQPPAFGALRGLRGVFEVDVDAFRAEAQRDVLDPPLVSEAEQERVVPVQVHVSRSFLFVDG